MASKSSSYVALVEGLAAVEIALPELRRTSVAQLMTVDLLSSGVQVAPWTSPNMLSRPTAG